MKFSSYNIRGIYLSPNWYIGRYWRGDNWGWKVEAYPLLRRIIFVRKFISRLKWKFLWLKIHHHKWQLIGGFGHKDGIHFADYYHCNECLVNKTVQGEHSLEERELAKFYTDAIIAEGKRLQEEGLTESEAAKVVIWGNKEGKSEVN